MTIQEPIVEETDLIIIKISFGKEFHPICTIRSTLKIVRNSNER
jgi:hypothetical protein